MDVNKSGELDLLQRLLDVFADPSFFLWLRRRKEFLLRVT